MTGRIQDVLPAAGTHASRPTATTVANGTLYSCTDHNLIYRSDGTAWSTWATVVAGGATLTGGRVYATATQVIANTTNTLVTFGAEESDPSGFHSTSSNTSRITVPSGLAGYYRFDASLFWQSPPSAVWALSFLKNGTGLRGILRDDSAARQTWAHGIGPVQLAVGDYIEVNVYHSSGGNRTIDNGAGYEANLGWQFLGT